MTEKNQATTNQSLMDSDLLSYDIDSIQNYVKKENVIGKIPTDAPLIIKLIPDLLDPNRAKVGRISPFWQITEHMHSIGTDAKGRPILRSHPCQKTVGRTSCPECNKYFELLNQIKDLGETTPDGKKVRAMLDRLAPRTKGWCYYITPDAEIVKCLKLPKDLINKLWGRPKTQYKEAIPSLIDEMKKLGINPYNLNSDSGWIKIWKTGEGFATTYYAEIDQRETPKIIDGRFVGKDTVFSSYPVPGFVKMMKSSELPNYREFEQKYALTPEESEEFARNPMVTPQRLLEFAAESQKSAVDETPNLNTDNVPDLGLMDEIDKVL